MDGFSHLVDIVSLHPTVNPCSDYACSVNSRCTLDANMQPSCGCNDDRWIGDRCDIEVCGDQSQCQNGGTCRRYGEACLASLKFSSIFFIVLQRITGNLIMFYTPKFICTGATRVTIHVVVRIRTPEVTVRHVTCAWTLNARVEMPFAVIRCSQPVHGIILRKMTVNNVSSSFVQSIN